MLGRDDIRHLLGELGDDLASGGIRGEMFIVGGAAMALAYNTRRSTRDIDAVFEPQTVVYEAARRVAARHAPELSDDWLSFKSVDDALEHIERTYPNLRLEPRVHHLLEELDAARLLVPDPGAAAP